MRGSLTREGRAAPASLTGKVASPAPGGTGTERLSKGFTRPPSRGGRRDPHGSLRVRANDPLIYIGDRRSPPIYIRGSFARTIKLE